MCCSSILGCGGAWVVRVDAPSWRGGDDDCLCCSY